MLALGLPAVLLPLAVLAQPAFDLRHDLLSDLAARGAASSWLGGIAVAAGGAAHLALVPPLAARGLRTAACSAGAAGACLLGVAIVPITCPRGATGCSGPDSGRAVPRPFADVLHRDLVAGFELAVVVLLVAVALEARRRGERRRAGLALVVMAASLTLLGGQQRGTDIGLWQLGWLATVLAGALVVVTILVAPAGADPQRDGSGRPDAGTGSQTAAGRSQGPAQASV